MSKKTVSSDRIEHDFVTAFFKYGKYLRAVKERNLFRKIGCNSFDEFISHHTVDSKIAMFVFHYECLMSCLAEVYCDSKAVKDAVKKAKKTVNKA